MCRRKYTHPKKRAKAIAGIYSRRTSSIDYANFMALYQRKTPRSFMIWLNTLKQGGWKKAEYSLLLTTLCVPIYTPFSAREMLLFHSRPAAALAEFLQANFQIQFFLSNCRGGIFTWRKHFRNGKTLVVRLDFFEFHKTHASLEEACKNQAKSLRNVVSQRALGF